MAEKGHVTRKALSEEVDKVVKYAMEHFDAEEHLMRSINYPYYEEHLAKHNVFRERTDSCVVDVENAVDIDTYAITVSKWLIGGFCEQVQTDDLKLAKFIQRKIG